MPLTGEYEPSQNDRTRGQVELYEASNGVEGGTLNGKPVIVLTYKGCKSGKIRKTPLMRIEHNGTYAVVASYAGAPTHPFWYRNIVANPLEERRPRKRRVTDSGRSTIIRIRSTLRFSQNATGLSFCPAASDSRPISSCVSRLV
jgi:hypothetical protein